VNVTPPSAGTGALEHHISAMARIVSGANIHDQPAKARIGKIGLK